MKNIFFTILILLLGLNLSLAQTETISDSTKYVVTKINNFEYIGYILSDDGREVLILTEKLGKIYLAKSDIKSIRKIEEQKEIVDGEYSINGPFTTRYVFTTNAFPVKKGESYALVNLYGPEIHFAISDKLGLGLMSTWMASPMALTIKYSLNNKDADINFSVGSIVGSSLYINNFKGYGGLHWLTMTMGDRKNNLSVSAGYGYLNTGAFTYYYESGSYSNGYNYPRTIETPAFTNHGPVFSVSGIAKVGAKASLLVDVIASSYQRSYYDVIGQYYPYYYDSLGNYVPGHTEYESTKRTDNAYALLIMIGMRFQKFEKRAFQVSLTGVSLFREYFNNGVLTRDNASFPFPMCTWFLRF